ncbi:unnamed protein product [Rotaria sp. Silwood2]|nr:unnamed protein product [Rotaria sp. Silwood2]
MTSNPTTILAWKPNQRPYPPTNRHSLIDPHDRPYFEFGLFDANTLRTKFAFYLEPDPLIEDTEQQQTNGRRRKCHNPNDRMNARAIALSGVGDAPILFF